jgi:hypothetical protein
MRLEGEQPSC